MDSRFYDAANRILKNDAEREAVLLALTRQISKVASAETAEDPASEMDQAKEFWKRVREFPERAFKTLKAVRERSTGVTVYDSATTQLKYDVFVLRLAYLRRYANHRNRYLRTVANLECLRTPVVRRFFWYANVDFQSMDSFFLRLTGDQEESLAEHAEISYQYLLGNESVDFPCFSEGFANAVANRFQTENEAKGERVGIDNDQLRYSGKSAIAYDLFGWDFGFKAYADENSAIKNPASLAGQTLLSLRGEDFSVNTESRGIYWWLYRTIRSNPLWGKGDVQLRAHVCPGFWATVFLWAFLVFGSPATFVLGLANAEEIYGMALLVPGAVTPLILLAIGYTLFMKKFGRGYDKKFAGASIIVTVATMALTIIGYHLAELARWMDWSEPINWMIAAFLPIWAGYAIARGKPVAPWKLPVLGPAFLAAIAGRATWLGYHEHPEMFFTVLTHVLEFVGLIAGVALVLFIGYRAYGFLKWALMRLDSAFAASKEKAVNHAKAGENKTVEAIVIEEQRWARLALVLGSMAFLFVWFVAYSVAFSGMAEIFVVPVVAMSLYVMALFGIIAWCGANAAYDFKSENFDQYVVARIVDLSNESDFVKALAKNPTFRRKDGMIDRALLERFVNSKNFRKAWYRLDEETLAKMASDATAEGVEYFLVAKTKVYLLPNVASGMKYGEARKAFKKELEFKAKRRIEAIEAENKRREARMKTKKTALDVVFFIPRALGSGIATLGLLKKTFDNHCPHIYRSKQVG